MFDAALREHLLGGATIIVGAVDADGNPYASRGYGASPVSDDIVHVFLDAGHTDLIGHVRGSGRLAVTSGNVFTFQSVQLKGGVEALGPATAGEHDTAVELTRRLISRIAQVENLPTAMFDYRIPPAFVTCTIRVDSIFDQTPGPMAGLPLTDGSQ